MKASQLLKEPGAAQPSPRSYSAMLFTQFLPGLRALNGLTVIVKSHFLNSKGKFEKKLFG